MYIKGLSLLDYLDLSNKVAPFTKAAGHESSKTNLFFSNLLENIPVDRISEIVPSSEEEKFFFSKGKDVLNENVLFGEVEYELLKDSKKHF